MGPETRSPAEASEFSVKYRLRYQPMVTGTEFFAKTNPPDPMELLNALTRLKA